MFAKRRILNLGSATAVNTPLLLPSFSSKGFPRVRQIMETMADYISDEVLVSAYDIHHKKIEDTFDFATLIFLDSGGYEASKDVELSETFETEHKIAKWTPQSYSAVIKKWKSKSPTVFVSFDHPNYKASTKEQITRAKKLPLNCSNHVRALLLMPETKASKRLRLKADIFPLIKEMKGFSVIGVTEKEVGPTAIDRMINVAMLRRELDKHHVDLPIYVFGSLDTISTYLYFLAGADIFDGLTWLRYAFTDGDTIYRHAYGTMQLPLNTNSDVVEGRCWSNNYQYMQEMRLTMINFLADNDFSRFWKASSFDQTRV